MSEISKTHPDVLAYNTNKALKKLIQFLDWSTFGNLDAELENKTPINYVEFNKRWQEIKNLLK